jgi:hypothetical protein
MLCDYSCCCCCCCVKDLSSIQARTTVLLEWAFSLSYCSEKIERGERGRGSQSFDEIIKTFLLLMMMLIHSIFFFFGLQLTRKR